MKGVTVLQAKNKVSHEVDSVTVGKDILDLLAGAMYVDPLNVYREYIQNAADAIDEAKQQGVLAGDGQVHIRIDAMARSILIRDNGEGISTGVFEKFLTNIGASHKRGTKLRGFRGVGRLSGLGYCQELVFRSRAAGDLVVSEMRWDGRELKRLLRDPKFIGGLSDVVQSIVRVNELDAEDYPEHFFEVELIKVIRLKNDLLLNEERVKDYLAQVAPVPFNEGFSHSEKIHAFLEKHTIREPIHIYLNDDKASITHKIRDDFSVRNGYVERIDGIKFFEFRGSDGEVAAAGWLCDHPYSGAIPKSQGLGGIRLRAGNIQVGDESILAELFPESRFSNWAIGEIHIISPKVLPNGRRDEFEPSVYYSHLQGEFSIQTRKIAHQIRNKSSHRNLLKNIELQYQRIQKWVDLLSNSKMPPQLKELIFCLVSDLTKQALDHTHQGKIKAKDDNNFFQKITELENQLKYLEIEALNNRDQTKYFPKKQIALEDVTKLILENAKVPVEGLSLAIKVVESFD